LSVRHHGFSHSSLYKVTSKQAPRNLLIDFLGCLSSNQHYFFLFAGTHDDCDRWLNNHRNLKPEIPCEDIPLMASQSDDVTPALAQGVTENDSDYDAILMKQIDEKMLRRIFRGLCGEE